MLFSEALSARVLEIRRNKKAADRGEPVSTSIPTGLTLLDANGGIERGVLTVIGGPTGEGKSTLREHFSEHAAKAGLQVLDFSFEDPLARTCDRSLARVTRLNSAHFRSLTDEQIVRVRQALRESAEWAVRIEIHVGLKTPEECLEIISNSSAELISVDYAQAFADGDRGLERTISDFAWKLAEDAQKNNRAIILYSQLRSEVEHRGMRLMESSKRRGDARLDVSGFRPTGVSDLAWSAALGQRAKGLGFIFRPGRYRKRFGEADPDDKMELLWPKRNFGPEGSIVIGFDERSNRVYNLESKK